MQYRLLGNTDVEVSLICLGTMTWGEQNTEAEAHEQMDYAVDQGINFIDTAELYPVPPKEETWGRTEECIGTWLEKRGKRDDIIIASKVVGRSDMQWFRGEDSRLNKAHITEAVEGSLKRLKTDYIDVYQLHWPERSTNFFGKLGYENEEGDGAIPLAETLQVLSDLKKAGKIRYIGLSNETPWGVLESIRCEKELGTPRVMSIQNPYNLLNRTFEVGLAEMAIKEKVGLLAYSPLAFGALSGKYLNGQKPEGARLTLYERFQRYQSEKAHKAIAKYVDIARKHGLDPAQMALAYVNAKPFLTSNIIGATSMEQLKANIDSVNIKLSDELLEEIEAFHQEMPNPCP